MNKQHTETLRTKEDWWFTCVDTEVLKDKELSVTARLIFTALCAFATINNRGCWPSNDTIAEFIGVSKSTVIRAYKELEARGVIARSDRFDEGAQTSSYTRIVGHHAPCYEGVADTTPPSCTDDTPPVAPMTHEAYQIKHIKDSLTREADLPNFTDMPLAFEDKKPVIPEDKKPLSGITANPEEIYTPDDAPEIMRATAEYLLLKTGRAKLTWSEISALRVLSASHYPSRVQKEIDTACERFTRKGRALSSLTFSYIAGSLQHQQSRSPTGRPVRKVKPKTAESAQSEKQYTQEEVAELEAELAELEARIQQGGVQS